MGPEIQRYVDASARTTHAENSARFSELESKIETNVLRLEAKIETNVSRLEANVSRLEAKIDAIQPGVTWQQIAGMLAVAVATALGGVSALFSYGSDQFGSGASLMRIIEQRVVEQREIDAEQNARLNALIGVLERQNTPIAPEEP